MSKIKFLKWTTAAHTQLTKLVDIYDMHKHIHIQLYQTNILMQNKGKPLDIPLSSQFIYSLINF